MQTPKHRQPSLDIHNQVGAVSTEGVDRMRRIAAVKVELRFGPDSDIARMLGLVES